VHLDLDVRSVEAVLALGATMVLPAAESGFRWSVLADPEGGELCTFERDGVPAVPPARLYEVIVDTTDTASAHTQAEWWAWVWGGTVVDDDRGFSWVEGIPGTPFATLDFGPVPEPKTVKNRIHWDVTCDDVSGLVDRGATVLAEPTPATGWHVLADPDGNEFCAFAPS
jgi:Glyoxalase-like domain